MHAPLALLCTSPEHVAGTCVHLRNCLQQCGDSLAGAVPDGALELCSTATAPRLVQAALLIMWAVLRSGELQVGVLGYQAAMQDLIQAVSAQSAIHLAGDVRLAMCDVECTRLTARLAHLVGNAPPSSL